MKTHPSGSRRRPRKRDLFSEIAEGVEALADARRGKRILRTHAVTYRPAPTVTPDEIALREELNISRGVLAAYLRINVRTIENWGTGAGPTERAGPKPCSPHSVW